MIHKVIIIGAGCAGLTAGLYCARAELKPIIFAGNITDKGGLLSKTSIVENYPGFEKGILGFDLIQNMEDQALKYGSTVIDRNVVNINVNVKPFKITDDNNEEYFTHSIIIATGSTPNKLGLLDETKLWGKGISSCAVCDGALYKNKNIIVVGGGDSALEHALFLTKFSKVTLIHRRDSFRASKAMQTKILNNPKINVIYDTIITKLNGEKFLESIECENVKTNEIIKMNVDGLFYGLGLTPNSNMFKGVLDLDDEGYIVKKINNEYETMASINGVFVAGDVSDKIYRQAIVASGDGCKSAIDVNNYLTNNNLI